MYLSDLQALAKTVDYKIDKLVNTMVLFLEEVKKIRIAIESLVNTDPYQAKEKANGNSGKSV